MSLKSTDRPIIIFPQATRVATNDRSQFKKGASRIYETLNIKCQPVAINSGNVWPKSGMLIANKTLIISILEPIDSGIDPKQFLEILQNSIYKELDNISYIEENHKLIEFKSEKYISKGIMPEEDGVIHKLANRNLEKRAISLHFYYPAIESFEGMRIFNLETGSIGILSEYAKTAKWNNNSNQFKEIKQNAFKFQSIEELNKNKSHLIQNIFCILQT